MTAAFEAYRLLFLWQFLRMRRWMLLVVMIQVALALGIVWGLAFLLPNVDSRSALFLSTGAPTMTLLLMGLTFVPQEVGRDKQSGRASYIAALPVPRLAPPAAEVTFWLLAQVPGTVLALVVASMRFDFSLSINIAVVPVILLVALSGAAVGYAIALVLRPEVASHVASFISIGLLLFSPINFPIQRLPQALQTVHEILPISHMADLVRWSLTGHYVDEVGLSFVVVALWCAAAVATTWRVATRRR